MHGLIVYVKEGFLFVWGSSLENCENSCFCFRLGLLHLVSYLVFLYQSLSSFWCMVFDAISSKICEVLSINPSADVLVFVEFNIHHKDWLTCSGGTGRPGELCYNLKRSYSYG